MSLVEIINEGIKQAMLSKDKVRLETLRGVKKEFLEALTAKGAEHALSDDQALKIIQKMVKQREESVRMYREAGREELATSEEAEIKVLTEFLPEQLSPEAVLEAVQKIVTELGATSMKDMGRVMGVATKTLGSQADGKTISEIVKQLLA
ncbi:MAG: GatB/YqeY domain-containing protein [Porphyromonas sp.]|nr:GatB/YqeY domain-containing protein [Porphyromonas sp.]